MRQPQHQKALRDDLHPCSYGGNDEADPKDAEITVPKRTQSGGPTTIEQSLHQLGVLEPNIPLIFRSNDALTYNIDRRQA